MGSSRRHFLRAIAAVAAARWAESCGAQLRRQQVIVCLLPSPDPQADEAARKHYAGLFASQGFVDGRDIDVHVVRAPDPGPETWTDVLRAPARAVVARRPDVIVVHMVWLEPVRAATSEVPIVFLSALDLDHAGVQTQRRPGTNVTGVAHPFFEMLAKRIELLRSLRPTATRAAVVHDDAGPANNQRIAAALAAAAGRFAIENSPLVVAPGGRADVVRRLRDRRVQLADFLFDPTEAQLAQMTHAGIATSFASGAAVRAGGLLAYLSTEGQQILASLVARVLRGEQPATMPAQQPRTFRLLLNLRTARALGIEVPAAIRLRADELIE